jgi:hypothetical protein
MDFIERLNENINNIPNLPIRCRLGYLQPTESFCVYPLPGSRVILEYMDGAKDQQLNYEFAMKSVDQEKIGNTLWLVSNYLEELSELKSADNSFSFNSISIMNKPFINQLDDKRNYVFMIDVQANITTYPTKEE